MVSERQSLLAKIHIAKKDALICSNCGRLFFGDCCPDCSARGRPLDEWTYRSLVEAVTGHDSCSRASLADLSKLYGAFHEAGFKARQCLDPEDSRFKAKLGTMAQIHQRAFRVFGEDGEARVCGFVEKVIGKSALRFCAPVELRRVIGWINRCDKYRRKKNAEKRD